ncbi:MAG: hypothetical protein JWL86_6285 [Rhizobium sp.]|nr:hypothetical protein [Rhizobium sp.]
MRIDHLVWYNADLAEGRRFFAERMDCEPLYGGEHPGEGTANAVMALGSSTYLEILGRDVEQDNTGLDPEVAGLQGSGLYHWAIGGVDLSELAQRAASAGFEGGAMVPGGRTKPDGKWLGWTCWGLRNHAFGSLIPFFIDWMDSEHPALSAPVGGSLADFEIFTPDAEGLNAVFKALALDIKVTQAASAGVVATLESSKGRLELKSFSPVPRGYVI